MRIFGSIKELVSLVFRTAAGKEVSVTSAAQSGTSPITVTIPDVGDSADTLVVADAAQTLTNKTLTSPTITGTGAIAGTFTGNITGDVTGNVSGTAANVTGIVLPTKGGTGIANDVSQTTTRSGNFAKTETLTNTTNVTYPTTGTLSTLAGTETLTNKLVSSGAVTGPSRVNVPTGTTAELVTGLTVDGSVGFDTLLDKLSVKTAAGVVTVGSGSGSGSGEINAVLNPSASEAITGWSVSGAGSPAVARVATGGPLSPVIPSMIRSSGGSAAAYSFYNFTLPASLTNKKLKIEWSQAAPTSGEWKVEMRTQAGVEYALSTDSSGDSLIPAASGKYSTTFDTDSTTTLQLRFVRVAGSGNLDVSNVIVGPGIQPQGAVVGEWLTAATPAGGWIGTSGPTNVDITVKQQRVGTLINLRYFVVATGTSAAFGEFYVKLPLGLTLLSTGLTNSQGRLPVGEVQLIKGGVTSAVGRGFFNGTATTEMLLRYEIDTNLSLQSITNTTPFDWNTTTNPSIMQLSATAIPISEWAGSGVINLAQNDVEYAYVDGWDTNTGNTTTLFGPNGGPISGTLTSARTKTITWPTATQANQSVWLEIKEAGAWQRAETRAPFIGTTSFNFGPRVRNLSATQTEVAFYQYQQQGSTFNSETGAANWSGLFTNWRLVRAVSGQAVGFGLADGVSSGLLPATASSMSDVLATQLGYKQYLANTLYNAGVTTTVAGPPGWSIIRGVFIPYRMQDGTWRLKFEISGTMTSIGATTDVTLVGITSKNVSNYNQPVAYYNGTSGLGTGYVPANGNTFRAVPASAVTSFAQSGDIELDSKPTWAY